MKDFKFLRNIPNVQFRAPMEFLLEYVRRLDYHYVQHHRIFGQHHPLMQMSEDLFNRTCRFIRERSLTSTTEVDRYVYFSYQTITDVDYEISNDERWAISNETYIFLNRRRINETI